MLIFKEMQSFSFFKIFYLFFYGKTPLHIACEIERKDIVQCLLENKNIDIHIKDMLGFIHILMPLPL